MNEAVARVYALLAAREHDSSWQAYRFANETLGAVEGGALLALYEAITDVLEGFLAELGEHGLQNQVLWGVDPASVDVASLADEYRRAWHEVKQLRAAGVSSRALIEPYVSNWIIPIGSRDWLSAIRPWRRTPLQRSVGRASVRNLGTSATWGNLEADHHDDR